MPTELQQWAEVNYLKPRHCGHAETMCDECIDSWSEDYYVKL